jgi:hypothetical protein
MDKNTIRFDVLQGRCKNCGGPLYVSRTIDWEGNRVHSIHCWNGHYEELEIEHFETMRNEAVTVEEIESILPLVAMVRVENETDS